MKDIKIKLSPELETRIEEYMRSKKLNKLSFYDLALQRFFQLNSEPKALTSQFIKKCDDGAFKTLHISDKLHVQLNEYIRHYYTVYRVKPAQYLIVLRAVVDLLDNDKNNLTAQMQDLRLFLTQVTVFKCPKCGQEIIANQSANICCGNCSVQFTKI